MRQRLPHPTSAFLSSMVATAVAADPADCVLGPIGRHAYATLFGVIPDVMAVLRCAARYESDQARLLDWYVTEPIASLGDLTASQLVSLGRTELVIAFLDAITVDGPCGNGIADHR